MAHLKFTDIQEAWCDVWDKFRHFMITDGWVTSQQFGEAENRFVFDPKLFDQRTNEEGYLEYRPKKLGRIERGEAI